MVMSSMHLSSNRLLVRTNQITGRIQPIIETKVFTVLFTDFAWVQLLLECYDTSVCVEFFWELDCRTCLQDEMFHEFCDTSMVLA